MKKTLLTFCLLFTLIVSYAQQRPSLQDAVLKKVSTLCLLSENYFEKFADYNNIFLRSAALDSLQHIEQHPRCAEVFLEGLIDRYGERAMYEIGFDEATTDYVIDYIKRTKDIREMEREAARKASLEFQERMMIKKFENKRFIEYKEASIKPSIKIQSDTIVNKIERLYYLNSLPEVEKYFTGRNRKLGLSLFEVTIYISDSCEIDGFLNQTPYFTEETNMYDVFLQSLTVNSPGYIVLPASGKKIPKTVAITYKMSARQKEYNNRIDVTLKKSKKTNDFTISNKKVLLTTYGNDFVTRLEDYLSSRPEVWSTYSSTTCDFFIKDVTFSLIDSDYNSLFSKTIPLVFCTGYRKN